MVPGLGYGRDKPCGVVVSCAGEGEVAEELPDGLEGAFTGGGFPRRVCEPLGDLLFGDGQGCLGWVGACEVLDPALASNRGGFGFSGCELPSGERGLVRFPKHGGLLV